MKTLGTLLIAMIVALCALPAQAQTVATSTTLNGAVTASATNVVVTSATGWSVGLFAYVDSEQMRVTAVSGTTITVIRGTGGTAPAAHATSSRIFVGNGNYFHQTDPDYSQVCTRGQGEAVYLPWINTASGTLWNCRGNSGGWNGTRVAKVTYNSVQDGTP
jgi:hypothetical protein